MNQQTVYLYSRIKQVQPFLLKGKLESYLIIESLTKSVADTFLATLRQSSDA